MEKLLVMLRAAGDATRLRLLLLLTKAELTVSELTQIVGQSQPRVSRHLKLLCEAGLLERFKEGAWVFYRAADSGAQAEFAGALSALAAAAADPVLSDDKRRLVQVRAARAEEALAYFRANAPEWERIRSLHAPEPEVEAAIVRLLREGAIDAVLDAGTGTGRMLELLAGHIRRGVGIDMSPEMLAIARDRLAQAGISNCQVRRGDVYRLPFSDGSAEEGFDAVLFHQVLHFLDDPQGALREAARVLAPGGRILIADFAPHSLEFLRTEYAHRRLGFSDAEVKGWFKAVGLRPIADASLGPRSAAEGLTVMVWMAQTQGVSMRRKKIEGSRMNLKHLAIPGETSAVSFEFFPPKTAEMETQLWNSIRRLAPLRPHFVSVTYGAGGSTRDRTHATVKRIVEETRLKPAAHLTCVGASKEQVNSVIRNYWDAGVRHIVTLRGDMPETGQAYAPHKDGYQSTAELVAGIRAIAPFEISVSGYPERHPDSPSLEWDTDVLKAKVDAGATRAITQFAFDTDLFARFRERAEKAGIRVPIVPGLMPTTNFKGVSRMAKRCGAGVPDWLSLLYDGLEDDLESRKLVASAVLVDQVRELKAEGFEQFHFYTLNQAELTFAVCRILGIQPAKDSIAA